jgi:hypothetical protein
MKIIHKSWLSKKQIKAIQKEKEATYICDNPLRLRDGSWANFPIAIFYAKTPHPNGSNWFGLYNDYMGRVMIVNAGEVEGREIDGLIVGDKIIYSSYRHHLHCLSDENGDYACIDGGIDYLKLTGTAKITKSIIRLKITKDGLMEV